MAKDATAKNRPFFLLLQMANTPLRSIILTVLDLKDMVEHFLL